MTLEGVDYSIGQPGSAALLAAGKHFAVRYLADDERGIFPGEYQELTTGGVAVAAVFEGEADRMLDGYNAGVWDAQFAQGKLERTGMPPTMPIYFACDVDATPEDQAAINAYLQGAASVIGLARVGVYGGYWVVKRAFEAGVAQWFWQTTAWSGGNLHPACHLYQYGYNVWIGGVNCDNTRALVDHYGQASDFVPHPAPPVVVPAAPKPKPEKLDPAALYAIWPNYNADAPVSRQWRHYGKLTGSYGKPDQPWDDKDTHGNKLFHFSNGLLVVQHPDGSAMIAQGI